MKVVAILIVVLIPFLVFSDSDKKKDKQKKTQTQTQPQTQTRPTVSYEVIKEGTSSGMRDAMAKVITTQKEWEDLWKKHTSILVPQPLLPPVDFQTESVVAIFSGEKKTSGYRIVLKDVSFKENDIVVTYRETQPPANSFVLQVITQPFLMLKVQKPQGGTIQVVKL